MFGGARDLHRPVAFLPAADAAGQENDPCPRIDVDLQALHQRILEKPVLDRGGDEGVVDVLNRRRAALRSSRGLSAQEPPRAT